MKKRSFTHQSPEQVLSAVKSLNPEVKNWGTLKQGDWIRLPKSSFRSYGLLSSQSRRPASERAKSLITESYGSETLHEGVLEKQVKQVLASQKIQTEWRWALSVFQENQRWGSVEFADRTEADLLSQPSLGGQLRWWRPGQLMDVEWVQVRWDNPRWVNDEAELFRGRFQQKVGAFYVGGGFFQQGYLRALSGSDLTLDVITHPVAQLSIKPSFTLGVFHLESEWGVTYQLSASSSELNVNSYLLSFVELRLLVGRRSSFQPLLFGKFETGEVSSNLTRQNLKQLRFGLGVEF